VRLKSFYARTVAEAMRMVRVSLGGDAIIVATREEDGGVRLTAAIEEDDVIRAPTARGGGRSRASSAYEEPVDVAQEVTDVLHRHGTPAAIAEKLVNAIVGLDTDDPVKALGVALDSVFGFHPLGDGRFERPLMLVGPPGVGKTLAVAKLAARAVVGKRSIGIITTDTVRAGGVEQLAAFTRLMKLRLFTVEDPAALADAIDVNQGAEQIVIDSAGRNPFNAEDMAELRRLLAANAVEPVLVLPAGIDATEAAEMGNSFRAMGVRRILVTRLDLSRRLGSMLAAVHESQLDFSDMSNTPKVADGLTPLNPALLARLMMPGQQRAARTTRNTGTHS
jgi:flagellar biosynthesis protein FlhF